MNTKFHCLSPSIFSLISRSVQRAENKERNMTKIRGNVNSNIHYRNSYIENYVKINRKIQLKMVKYKVWNQNHQKAKDKSINKKMETENLWFMELIHADRLIECEWSKKNWNTKTNIQSRIHYLNHFFLAIFRCI